MGTKFEEVFERAIFKFSDFAHLSFSETLRAEILKAHLLSAIVDFKHSSRLSLAHSLIEASVLDSGDQIGSVPILTEVFDVTLGEEEIQILATGIVYHWLSSQTLKSEHMRNILHNKDFKSYSPGNLLKELRELRTAVRREFRGLITSYSFRHSNIDLLSVTRRNV